MSELQLCSCNVVHYHDVFVRLGLTFCLISQLTTFSLTTQPSYINNIQQHHCKSLLNSSSQVPSRIFLPKLDLLWQLLALISCVKTGRGSPVEVEGGEISR